MVDSLLDAQGLRVMRRVGRLKNAPGKRFAMTWNKLACRRIVPGGTRRFFHRLLIKDPAKQYRRRRRLLRSEVKHRG